MVSLLWDRDSIAGILRNYSCENIHSSGEWIIDLDSEGREGMIWREINTTNIPETGENR